MEELFLSIVNMSISAGWTVLAVLILRLFLKKAPKWITVLMWGIVAARLVLPIRVESIFSLVPSAETFSPGILLDDTPEIQTGISALNSALNPIISGALAPNPGDSANPLQILVFVFAVLWLIGAAVMLLYTALTYRRLHRRVCTAVRLQENIFQSEQIGAPFVLGIVRPRIYLPFAMQAQDMTHVIAHEQAHLRRKDHLWKPLGFLLLTLHWFNPLIWLAYVLLCRDIELACDEKVIKELDARQRADYSQALLSCSVNRRTIAACPLAFGEVGVKRRIQSVLTYKKPAFWLIVVAILASVAVAVCFLTDPKDTVKDVLKPHTYWVDNTGSITFSVMDNLAIEGYLGKQNETISIGFRFAGRNGVAEIYRGDWAYAQSSAEEPILTGRFTTQKGTLVFEVESDAIGFGIRELFFQEYIPYFHSDDFSALPPSYALTVIDMAIFDIDGDGKSESCTLRYGYTSGIRSYIFSVSENGFQEYASVFTPLCALKGFAKTAAGETVLYGPETDGDHYFRLTTEGEHVILTEISF